MSADTAGAKRYKVIYLGPAGIVYKEGRKQVHVFSEMLVGDEYDIVIYLDEIKSWEYPNDYDAFTVADKDVIKSRISKKLGRRTRIDWK